MMMNIYFKIQINQKIKKKKTLKNYLLFKQKMKI